MNAAHNDDLALIKEASIEAGKIAMRFFGSDNEVWHKQGDSPVSEADFAVDKFLRETLLKARPDYGWLSEETEDDKDRLQKQRVFVVDPIDGTRGYLAGSKQWCVSVAIVENQRPFAAVLECPALLQTFSAVKNQGPFLNDSPMALLSGSELRTITGSRKLNSIIEEHDANDLTVIPFVPSLAYRIAMVANNELDAALARPGAQDWDLAAADLLLHEAGGSLVDVDGNLRLYNQSSTRSGSLLASGSDAQENLMALAKSGGFLH